VLVYWELVFFASLPFSEARSVICQPACPLLSVFYDGLLIIFQFCRAVRLWMLLSGPGDELCELLPALFQAVAYHLLAVGLPTFPAFVY
jgi:hypothetical protein